MLARSCVHAFGPCALASPKAIRYAAEKHFTVGLLLTGLTMDKALVFVAFLSFGTAQAQPSAVIIPQAAVFGQPVAVAAPAQQVVNLGDVEFVLQDSSRRNCQTSEGVSEDSAQRPV